MKRQSVFFRTANQTPLQSFKMIEAKKLFLEPLDFESPDADDFFRKLLSGSTSKSLSDAEKIYLEGHVLSVGTSQSSDSSLVEKASEEPSDGGLQGWVQCVCSFLLFFNSWGLINSFGAFLRRPVWRYFY